MPFDWASLPDSELDRIAALDPEAMCREILAREPKTSGRELQAAAKACGHDVSKAQCQAWRESWKAGLPTGQGRAEIGAAEQAPSSLVEATARLEEATRIGDARAADKWSAIVARLAGMPSHTGPKQDAADWALLTGPELDTLHYLVSKAYGADPIDEEQRLEWDRCAKALARLADVG